MERPHPGRRDTPPLTTTVAAGFGGVGAAACRSCGSGEHLEFVTSNASGTFRRCATCSSGEVCADNKTVSFCSSGEVPNAERGATGCEAVAIGWYSDDGRSAKSCAPGQYPNSEVDGVAAAGSVSCLGCPSRWVCSSGRNRSQCDAGEYPEGGDSARRGAACAPRGLSARQRPILPRHAFRASTAA